MNTGEEEAQDGEEEAQDDEEDAKDSDDEEDTKDDEEDAKDREEDTQDSDDQDAEVIQSSTLAQAAKVFRGLYPPAQKTPANPPHTPSPGAPTSSDCEHHRGASKSHVLDSPSIPAVSRRSDPSRANSTTDSSQKRPRTSDGKLK